MKYRNGSFKRNQLIGMLLVVLLFFALAFFSIYRIFMDEIDKRNTDITLKVFEQIEDNLNENLAKTERQVVELINDSAVQDFIYGFYISETQKYQSLRRIILGIDKLAATNDMLASVVLINHDGLSIGSSYSRVFYGRVSMDVLDMHEGSFTKPLWNSKPVVLFLEDNGALTDVFAGGLKNRLSYFYGLMQLKSGARPYYLLIKLNENSLSEEYQRLLYNDSTVHILSEDGEVMSTTDEAALSALYPLLPDMTGRFGSVNTGSQQVIYYRTAEHNFLFVNQIPIGDYHAANNRIILTVCSIWSAIALVLMVFVVLWIRRYAKPVEELIAGMRQVSSGNLSVSIDSVSGISELDRANLQFNQMAAQIRQLIDKVASVESEKREETIKALQYQINPHFIYNSINAIRWMSMATGAANVASALVILSNTIEPVLRDTSFFWHISDECTFTENYIKMMQLRMGYKIEYTFETSSRLSADQPILKFILQPLVENCFTHGLEEGEPLSICIKIDREDRFIIVSVRNDGIPIPAEKLSELNCIFSPEYETEPASRIGIRNIYRRILLTYGSEVEMFIQSGEVTVTTIKIPVQ